MQHYRDIIRIKKYTDYNIYLQTYQKRVCNHTQSRSERNSNAHTVFLVVFYVIVISSRHNGQKFNACVTHKACMRDNTYFAVLPL